MPVKYDEIIDEIEANIRKCGGAWNEWCVGTAKDSRGPFFRQHQIADLGDGLAYREAYTTDSAQAVVAHLVNDRGLQLDHDAATEAECHSALPTEAERCSALPCAAERHPAITPNADLKVGATSGATPATTPQPHAVPEPGRLVFVYRKNPSALPPPAHEHPPFRKFAA